LRMTYQSLGRVDDKLYTLVSLPRS
jgi:hypothetical protein